MTVFLGKPKIPSKLPTEKQLNNPARFSKGTQYGQRILKDELLKAMCEVSAKGLNLVFNVVAANYLNAPEIEGIFLKVLPEKPEVI